MFARRKTLTGRTTFDKNFLVAFKEKLIEANLDCISVKLPHNYLKEGEENEIDIEEFINRGRNYPSIILKAVNKNSEEMKILFVNISSKAFFYDHTFPSGHSEPSEIYITTTDPVRTWGLFEYFYNYLKNSENKAGDVFYLISFFLSLVVIVSEFSSLLSSKRLLLTSKFGYPLIVDFAIIFFSLFLIYKYYSSEKGIYLNERNKNIPQFLLLLLKGEFRDNPMFNFIISIIASIIASLILLYFGGNE